jgi:translation initiation factor 1 (eIF-1/SUI1)
MRIRMLIRIQVRMADYGKQNTSIRNLSIFILKLKGLLRHIRSILAFSLVDDFHHLYNFL